MSMPGPGREDRSRSANAVPLSATSGRQLESAVLQLPSFLVVGPPRTGTSWIHRVLQGHANLPCPTKETRFFDSHFHRGLKWYSSHFSTPHPDRPLGEIAPTYFASAQARERIAQTIPRAKLIFAFRHPVQRLISLYRVKRAYGLLSWSFEEALQRDPELLASSQYATCLQRWQEAFPPEQLLITLYEDLRESPQLYLDRVLAFLGVPGRMLTEAELKHVHSSQGMTQPRCFLIARTATAIANWCKANSLDNVVAGVRDSRLRKLFLGGGPPFPEISRSVLEMISAELQPEVEALQRMMGRDLSVWNWSKGDGTPGESPNAHRAREPQLSARAGGSLV
jgi:hypothetical protein